MLQKHPGVLVGLAGLGGIIVTFVEGSNNFSRIPLTIFFLLLFVVGIVIEYFKNSFSDDVYGEVNSSGKVV